MNAIPFTPTSRESQMPLREVVRRFTPNWFTASMGTGALSLTLNQFPLDVPGLHGLAAALWLCNIAIFATCAALYGARWLLFFDEARRIFSHPTMPMFFGAIPMALATIVNGFVAFGPAIIGDAAIDVAHALWWVDAGMSVACGIAIPYFMFTRQQHRMEAMTAVWLLPVVACEVAAVSAGIIAPHLPAAEAFQFVILGYLLWAMSVPLAMSILVVLFLRLALHKLPENTMGASAWLALGPIGTGALGLVVLGNVARDVFPANGLAAVGDVAFGVGVIGGLLLWGYGLWWLALALLKTRRYVNEGLPFNLGWWGFTFPLGVYTLSTLALAKVTGVAVFGAAGGVMVVCLAAIWVVVALRTLDGARKRTLFVAPYLPTHSAATPAPSRSHSLESSML